MSTRKIKGLLQYDVERGVVYFFSEESGEAVLRLEGIRNVPEGHQLYVHLVDAGAEHHHENCGNRAILGKGPGRVPGSICAVKLPEIRGFKPREKAKVTE